MPERAAVTIRGAESPADIAIARTLFQEYAKFLELDLSVDLSFQDFDHELETLPGAYAEPAGCILLAEANGVTVGCVAVRPLEDAVCEMKRLYVRPEHRGLGAGRDLAVAALREARARGYHRMRLDTVPGLDAAIALYRALGFRAIQPYRPNPTPGALYMERDL